MNSIQDGHKGITLAINALCVTLILAALVFCVWRLAGLMELRYDAEMYYFTLKKFESTGEIFHRSNGQATLESLYRPGGSVYKFAPLYLAWMVPFLDRVSLDEFYAVYCAWQIIFYVAIAAFAIWSLKPYADIKKISLTTCLIFLLSFPFYELLRGTSIEIFMLFVLIAAWVISPRGPRLAGVLLSYLAVIKIYPAFMLLYFAATKKWKVLQGFVYGGIGFLTLSVILFGWQENFFYFTTVLPVMLREIVSLKSMNLNLFADPKIFLSDQQAHHFFQLWRIAVLLLLALVCLRMPDDVASTAKPEPVRKNRLLLFLLFILTMHMMMPNYWLHYQTYLQLPAIVVLCYFWERKQFLLTAFSCLLAFILIQDNDWAITLATTSDVFLSKPAEYWQARYAQNDMSALWEISPIIYVLYFLTGLRFLLLPTYFALVFYIMMNKNNRRLENKEYAA